MDIFNFELIHSLSIQIYLSVKLRATDLSLEGRSVEPRYTPVSSYIHLSNLISLFLAQLDQLMGTFYNFIFFDLIFICILFYRVHQSHCTLFTVFPSTLLQDLEQRNLANLMNLKGLIFILLNTFLTVTAIPNGRKML